MPAGLRFTDGHACFHMPSTRARARGAHGRGMRNPSVNRKPSPQRTACRATIRKDAICAAND